MHSQEAGAHGGTQTRGTSEHFRGQYGKTSVLHVHRVGTGDPGTGSPTECTKGSPLLETFSLNVEHSVFLTLNLLYIICHREMNSSSLAVWMELLQ